MCETEVSTAELSLSSTKFVKDNQYDWNDYLELLKQFYEISTIIENDWRIFASTNPMLRTNWITRNGASWTYVQSSSRVQESTEN